LRTALQTQRGKGNLLDLAVKAARAKATVGEMSSALERAFNRHQPPIRLVTGVYSREAANDTPVERARQSVAAFEEAEGKRPTHPRRQDGPRRARPGPEGCRLRVQRSRVRRRNRALVCDA
jgi:hypothetical protein